MERKIVDLHVHSTYSDGTFTPQELVTEALHKKLSAFALTDHDTMHGVSELIEAAKPFDIEIIPGVEISCDNEGHEIHIVGLFIDLERKDFQDFLKEQIDGRNQRNVKMIEKLQAQGFDITLEILETFFPNSIITRAHMARYLLEKKYVKSITEAFDRYLGDHAPCFVKKPELTIQEAISQIHAAFGIAILAHPLLYHMSLDKLKNLVSQLKKDGIDGLEAIYSTYSTSEEQQMKALAKEFDLLISGGSDFHGANKPGISLAVGRGHLYIPYSILESMKERKKTYIK